ncbi:hypothetical protein NEHOM01_1768 [Nematocida homosporus]|uniref:uncharacterized protein n=1 Tax=Nematocida homosporus TaxID=1912981 RepID=UPI00221FFAC2|nr:uncharacterized protein NEHOM01_1768 [Nematocida homosporus]KAI5186879.1 hypothetical protein NEHOM01_1768 [Nematocida homosporus]
METTTLFKSFEEAMDKETAVGEFKDANTHHLKRRFSEYYASQKRKWGNFTQFTFGHNPIEKFKDITAIFTITLYPDYVVVGPAEKEGTRHPYTDIINAILSYINRNLMHPYLLDLLDRGEYPFYDNHIVVEVVDHRCSESSTHRVLLKGAFSELPYTPALILSTKTDELEEARTIAKTAKICLDPSPEVFEVLKLQDYNEKKLDQIQIEPPQKRKVQIGGIIKEYRRIKELQKKEAFQGLERHGATQIYRTVKFVGGAYHYSINAIASADYIEVVFRQGDTINTALGGFIQKRKFTSMAQIDIYLESIRKLLEIYHTDLKCICDMSASPRKPKPLYTSPPPPRPIPEDIPRRVTPPAPTMIPPITPSPTQALHLDRMRFQRPPEPKESSFEPAKPQFDPPKQSWPDKPKEEIDDFSFDYINKKFI